MNNVVLSTRSIDDLISDVADAVVKRLDLLNSKLVISQKKEIPSEIWLNIDSLISYLPERPAKATIYSWVHNNTIPYYKTGKHLRFLQSEIDNWIKSGRKKTEAEIAQENDTFLASRNKKAAI